ncbi:MAG: hypothetical protein V4700_04340 [Pseudomonadota bacterium]
MNFSFRKKTDKIIVNGTSIWVTNAAILEEVILIPIEKNRKFNVNRFIEILKIALHSSLEGNLANPTKISPPSIHLYPIEKIGGK